MATAEFPRLSSFDNLHQLSSLTPSGTSTAGEIFDHWMPDDDDLFEHSLAQFESAMPLSINAHAMNNLAPPAQPTQALNNNNGNNNKKRNNAQLQHPNSWSSSQQDFWGHVSQMTKTPEGIQKRYNQLVDDIRAIESGRVPIPGVHVGGACEDMTSPWWGREFHDTQFDTSSEPSSSDGSLNNDITVPFRIPTNDVTQGGAGGKEASGLTKSPSKPKKAKKMASPKANGGGTSGGGNKQQLTQEQERRKGIPWTEEEHRLFLLGLVKFGKGDWRSISRNFVVSRTPTQVASHAQKYFIRLNSMNKKDKRRSSIHDITDASGPTTSNTSTQFAR